MNTSALNIDSVTGLKTPAKVPRVLPLSAPRLLNSTYPSPSEVGDFPIPIRSPNLRKTPRPLINGAFSLETLTLTGSAFVEPTSDAIIFHPLLSKWFTNNKTVTRILRISFVPVYYYIGEVRKFNGLQMLGNSFETSNWWSRNWS